MKTCAIIAALLISGGMAAAQQSTNPPQPPRQYDSSAPTRSPAEPRLDAEGYNLDAPARPETRSGGQAQPRNSPDPAPRPGEQPRPIPR